MIKKEDRKIVSLPLKNVRVTYPSPLLVNSFRGKPLTLPVASANLKDRLITPSSTKRTIALPVPVNPKRDR